MAKPVETNLQQRANTNTLTVQVHDYTPAIPDPADCARPLKRKQQYADSLANLLAPFTPPE